MRRKLLKAIGKFKAIRMWTLTVNPSLFGNDPKAVLVYLKSERCVGELVRTLRKLRLLLSDNYFYVIEFHKSGFPHIHILFDARRIKKAVVQARWDALGPKTADGSPPTFGWVWFSPRRNRFKNPEHAANYATKYLTKHPAEGFPEWLLQIRDRRRISRCGHNKDLFSTDKPKRAAAVDRVPMQLRLRPIDDVCRSASAQKSAKARIVGKMLEGPPNVLPSGDGVTACSEENTCFCRKCRGENRSSIAERVARCGQASVLLEKRLDANGKPLRKHRSDLARPYDAIVAETGAVPFGGGIELPSWAVANRLERECGGRDPHSEGMLPRDVEGTPSEPAYKLDERMQDLHAEQYLRDRWRRDFDAARMQSEAEPASSPPEPTGGDPPLQAGGHPAGRRATLSCPLASDDGCDEAARIESVGEGLAHLREVHCVTGDPAWELLNEAIDDLGDDVSRHRWERAVADALAGLLGDDDAGSREKGEAA